MTQAFVAPAREGGRKKGSIEPEDIPTLVRPYNKDQPQAHTIIAVDPGGTSGWALFSFKPEALLPGDTKLLESILYWTCGEFVGAENLQVDQLVSLCAAWPEADLVVEDFILRQFRQGRELLAPVRITAALSYGIRETDGVWKGRGPGRRMYLQQPGLAMSTITDERMKRSGFYNPTVGKPHARDAVRHALTFARRKKANLLFDK